MFATESSEHDEEDPVRYAQGDESASEDSFQPIIAFQFSPLLPKWEEETTELVDVERAPSEAVNVALLFGGRRPGGTGDGEGGRASPRPVLATLSEARAVAGVVVLQTTRRHRCQRRVQARLHLSRPQTLKSQHRYTHTRPVCRIQRREGARPNFR